MPGMSDTPEAEWDGDTLKALGGYTWPGIEYGHPPGYKYSFFEYIDALRSGKVPTFKKIEAESKEWWFPTLDRGSGAALHFAVDHGQLGAVKLLLEHRCAEVNQQDKTRGWTPLMRCAQMAHYTHAPYFEVFEYLLEQGADPSIRAFERAGKDPPKGLLDIAVNQDVLCLKAYMHNMGRGWKPGEVRARLADLIEKHQSVPKRAAFVYDGPSFGEAAMVVLEAWKSMPDINCPQNWRPPPPAGFQGSQGIRLASKEPWRPAGEADGSCFLRRMTDAELAEQSRSVQPATK